MEIFILIGLIVLNGLFAMSEIALVTARKARLVKRAEEGDQAAAVAVKLGEDPTRFLSTIQIGITSIGILNGIVGEAALAGPLAEWLQGRPEVSRVLYPPLLGAVGHDLWARDFNGAASLMGVVMKGGDTAAGRAFLDALSLFGMGYSWGGFESLIIPFDCRGYRTASEWNPGGPCLRLQVGLEDLDDLKADLAEGFARLKAAD